MMPALFKAALPDQQCMWMHYMRIGGIQLSAVRVRASQA